MKPSPLTVRPVRNYPRPKYPSWQDPNPLLHPQTVPYPLKKKAFEALLASGVVGSLMLAQCAAPKKQLSEKYQLTRDSLFNPFTSIHLQGVPYHPSNFGTGMPERIDEKEIRSIFEKAFLKNGLELSHNYVLETDSLNILLDGYNAQSRTGYLLVDELRSNGSEFMGFNDGSYLQKYVNMARRFLTVGEIDQQMSAEFNHALWKVRQEQGLEKWESSIYQIAQEESIREAAKEINSPWLKARLDEALNCNEPVLSAQKRNKCSDMLEIYYAGMNMSIPSEYMPADILHLIMELDKNNSFPLPEEHLHTYSNVFAYCSRLLAPRFTLENSDIYHNKQAETALAIHRLLSASGEELQKNIADLALESEAYFVSEKDVQFIRKLEGNEHIHIAMIDVDDPRLSYFSIDSIQYENYQRKLLEAKRKQDPEQIGNAENALKYFKQYLLGALEKEANRYILWAKEQGRY